MSDTSIISKVSSYDVENRRNTNQKYYSSCWNQYWFHITTSLLSLIILITSSLLGYDLYKQVQQDRKRRRIQKEFKRKHGLASKVLDMVKKDSVIAKWLKANKGQTLKIFTELMNDMVETIFGE
ncbi:unnamed protein product [Rotaria sp. Silwood2]|nr:unnamed protein product [Rotaria sp. Silwood2]CAF2725356.1 unnamed protein product [Rotaria sp. Silwood2]CAF2945262.1 unnamed protein product [Rotaria sp. Silwood2]CAF3490828.1 unnamed protein product [Rotaria sp. Silwood2]CAF4421401.1 unnamed protein product [Rotaria sp. Silwood2]